MARGGRQRARIGVLLIVGLWGAACSRAKVFLGPDVTFPRLDSARDQFQYAADYDRSMLVGSDAKKVEERSRYKIAAYQMVLDHFPDDQIYAPLAEAAIANCYFKMKDYGRTIRIYKSLEERSPNYPFVHAQAEWMMGRSHDALGESAEAKRHYKRCIDTFQYHKNEEIKTFVGLCREQYIAPSVPARSRK